MTKILFLLVAISMLSACGSSNSLVQSITVSTSVDQNQNQWVNLDSKLKMGALQFPAMSIPIMNPKNVSEILGKVSLSPGVDGTNLLSVQANLNQLHNNALAQDNLLPNGNAIPISGMTGVLSVKIKDKSKVYIGANANQFMIGLALVLPAFDSIGKYLPGAGLFLPLPQDAKVNGVAGVFTGGEGQNGLGLFIVTPNTIQAPSTSRVSSKMAMSSAQGQSQTQAQFVVSDENSSKNNSLKRSLYFLSMKRQVLTVE